MHNYRNAAFVPTDPNRHRARVCLPTISFSNPRSRERVLSIAAAGFILAIIAVWVTEYFDPPFSFQQVLVLTGVRAEALRRHSEHPTRLTTIGLPAAGLHAI